MSGRLATTALLALILTGLSTGAAEARPWTASYDWQGQAATGYENWTVNEQPAPGGPGPWYQASLGGASQGRGLVIAPTGGRVYDNGNPSSQLGGPATILRWQVPGASTITRGVFSTLRYRNEDDDQYFRVRIYGGPGADARKDFGPAYGQSSPATTYSLPTTTLTPTGPGTTVEAWLFTVCHPNPPGSGVYACPNIPSGTGTFSRVGTIDLTLDDPDQPTVDVASSPPIDDGWVNKRRPQKLTTTATDPSSGIQRIRTQFKLGTSTRTLGDATITCDPLHRTAGRGGLVCPATATASATDRATDSSTKDRTYIVTVWDYAGNQTVKTLVVRRDITKPSSGSIGGQLNTVSRKWTNRRDTIPVTVRASDSHSGVARVALSAQRVGSGRTIDLGTATPPCDRGCKTTSSTVPVDLSRLDRDGRYRLRLQVTDRAGNQRSFTVGPQLKIDRGAPRPIGPAPTYTVRNDGSVRVLFTPSRDPQPGSGRIRLYMVRYYPAPTTDAPLAPATARFARIRVASARAATTKESRFRKSRSRAITFHPAKDGIDTDRPVALVELDDTSGVFAPPEQADGEQGVPGERRATPRFLTEQELWKLQGLDKVENAGKLLANAPKTAPVLRPVLRGLVKGVGRSAILALVGSLVFPESTGCDARPTPGMFNSQARTAFDAARAAISRAASAPAGRNTTIRRSVARARKLFRALQPAIDTQIRLYGDPCDRAGKVGQAGKDAISPALQASYRHLNDLSVQKQRADARKWAKARSRRQTVPETHCRDARKLEGRWSKSSGYVVYWSPAPPPDASVRYVGISRSLRSRCSKHPEYRRFGLTTLKLPHLTSEEAHNVEEALIAHWGHGREGGQLLGNKIHSIRPERPEYCTRLLRGQSLLVLFGYGRYASAHFTRTKRCIGVG